MNPDAATALNTADGKKLPQEPRQRDAHPAQGAGRAGRGVGHADSAWPGARGGRPTEEPWERRERAPREHVRAG